MSSMGFAKLPAPPYYAVIFSSQRTATGEADYAAAADAALRAEKLPPARV